MSMKFLKRILAATIAATLVVAVPVTVFAEEEEGSGGEPGTGQQDDQHGETPSSDTEEREKTPEEIEEEERKAVEAYVQMVAAKEKEEFLKEVAVHEEIIQEIKENTAKSTTAVVDGKTVKSNVPGAVDVTNSKTYSAVIVQSPGGAAKGDKQVVYSKTAKESPEAFASAQAAAANIGGTIVGDAINADITLNNGGSAEIVLKNALSGKAYIVQVGDKGATSVLDATVNGKVVTFTPTNGHFTYFVVQ